MSVEHQTDITEVSKWVHTLPAGPVEAWLNPDGLRPLGRHDRSAFLERETRGQTTDNIRTVCCPICGLPTEAWDETRTAKHFERDDHDWAALMNARDRWDNLRNRKNRKPDPTVQIQ